LVPLIVERKRIKQHPDVQKVTDATSKVASKTSLTSLAVLLIAADVFEATLLVASVTFCTSGCCLRQDLWIRKKSSNL
jgi:hypothetical protein